MKKVMISSTDGGPFLNNRRSTSPSLLNPIFTRTAAVLVHCHFLGTGYDNVVAFDL